MYTGIWYHQMTLGQLRYFNAQYARPCQTPGCDREISAGEPHFALFYKTKTGRKFTRHMHVDCLEEYCIQDRIRRIAVAEMRKVNGKWPGVGRKDLNNTPEQKRARQTLFQYIYVARNALCKNVEQDTPASYKRAWWNLERIKRLLLSYSPETHGSEIGIDGIKIVFSLLSMTPDGIDKDEWERIVQRYFTTYDEDTGTFRVHRGRVEWIEAIEGITDEYYQLMYRESTNDL